MYGKKLADKNLPTKIIVSKNFCMVKNGSGYDIAFKMLKRLSVFEFLASFV